MTDLQQRPEHAGRPPVPVPSPLGEHPGNPLGLVLLGGLLVFAGVAGGWPVLVVIAALVGMIFMHELGHFLTAKWAGMKVTEFFIGFGPRIWSFRKGETEYGVKAIPAGAYVKIVGMHNLDEYDPADADRTYLSKPYWRRMSVAVAGSTMHFVLALTFLFSLFAFVGVPGGSLTDPEWVVAEGIVEDSPAAAAGVEAGDRIVSVDGEAVESFEDFTEVVRARPGETVPVVVERAGDRFEVEVTLAARHPQTRERVGFFGVGDDYVPQTVGAVDAVGESFAQFGELVEGTLSGLAQILSPSGLVDLGQRVIEGPDSGPAVAGGNDDEPAPSAPANDDARPISVIGVGQIGAELLEREPSMALQLFVLLNVFIGVFNLVPLLPLDGGHVAIATYEKIRSMLQHGRPYHVDVAKLLPITYAVVLVLVFLGISTIYLDIADPIGG
jgi:membrane-associated protease RseP (regulator of RpoE activity)